MSTLGAFYMAYNNKKATSFVLENFRRHYPDSPVTLISDGGENFEDIASQFSTHYVKSHNIFYTPGLVGAYYDSVRLKELWRRHKISAENANTDYIIILEDDVLVQGKVDLSSKFSLKGTLVGNKMPALASRIVRESGGETNNDEYGACGGAIYNSKDLLSIYDNTIDFIDKHHDNLFFNIPENMNCCACDCTLVFHFNRNKLKYERAEWLAEVHRQKENWQHFPVVHQYKNFY
jgi:hypothetical protein